MARALTAYAGDPPRARSSQDRIFEEEGFDKLLANLENSSVALAYFALESLDQQAANTMAELPSSSIRYGKYAMLFAVSRLAPVPAVDSADARSSAKQLIATVVGKWKAFEQDVSARPSNSRYLAKGVFNFDGYYKGATVADDIKSFAWM